MPRYHFHCADGSREPDVEGTELPDEGAAQLEAMRYAGEVLQHEPGRIWSEGQWRVEVTDEKDTLLFIVITIAVDAPRPGERRSAATRG